MFLVPCLGHERVGEVQMLIDTLIDDPYSIEQLRDPRMNVSVVRPLVDRCYEDQDLSMSEFCFVLVSGMERSASDIGWPLGSKLH